MKTIKGTIKTSATNWVGSYPMIGQLDFRDDLGGGDGQTQGPVEIYSASQLISFDRPDDLAYGEEKNRTITFNAILMPQSARHYGDIIIDFHINNKKVTFSDRIRAIKNEGVKISYTFGLAGLLNTNEAFQMEIDYRYNWAGFDDTNPNNPKDESAAVAVVVNYGDIVLNYQEINRFQPPLSTEAYIVNEKNQKTGDLVFGPNSKIKIAWNGIKSPSNSEIKKYKIFYTFNNDGFGSDYNSEKSLTFSKSDVSVERVKINETEVDIYYVILELSSLNLDFTSMRKKKFWYGIQTSGKYIDNSEEISTSITSFITSYSTMLFANSLPSAPEISFGNTVITEVVIPSNGSGTVIVTAGNDNDFQNYYVGLKDSGQWRTSPVIFTLKEKGEYSFVTFDGLEQGPETKLTVIENIKPIAEIVNAKVADVAEDESTKLMQLSASGKEANDKKITALQWYCRANNEKSLLNSSEFFKLGSEIRYEEENLSFKYTFNPESGLKPFLGDSYQIGLAVKDDYEWSDISWFNTVFEMYGKIATDEPFEIQIFNNYEKAIGGEFSNSYLNYFKASDKGIRLTATLPKIPEGLKQLYYQLFYSTNGGYSWIPYKTKQPYTDNTELTITDLIDASNIFNDVIFKIQITDLENNPSQVKEKQSNKLYYAMIPQFPPSTQLILDPVTYSDGRNNIRPNNNNDKDNITSTKWHISIPNSVCDLTGREYDLRYSVILHNGSKERNIITEQACPDNSDALSGDLNFSEFHDEELYGSDRIGPYNSYLTFVFKDVFDQEVTSARLNFVVDFREPPEAPSFIAVGGSKLLDRPGNQFKKYDKTGWNKDNYYDSNIFMNYEHFIVIFDPSELSYPGQEIDYYSFIIKEKIDEENYKIIKTFKVPVGELSSASNYYSGNALGGETQAAILPIGNIFNDSIKHYSMFISATDVLTYNGNTSKEGAYKGTDGIIGVNRALPVLSINNINIVDDSDIPKCSVVSITSSEISSSWIDKYEDEGQSFFSRANNYSNILGYNPEAILTLQFAETNTFDEPILAECPINTLTSGFSIIDEFKDTIVFKSENLYNKNKIFIRAALKLTTGLKIVNGNISTDEQIIYSNIIIYTGASATVYYRENGVGFNSAPQSDDILLINQTRNRNKMRLFGSEANSEGTLDHLLTFNINTGTIVGENFYLTDSLIPINWMGSDNDWGALAALLPTEET